MITSHVWRQFHPSCRPVGAVPEACAFMNCRRPPGEHASVKLPQAKAARS